MSDKPKKPSKSNREDRFTFNSEDVTVYDPEGNVVDVGGEHNSSGAGDQPSEQR